jgi:hypothetical protein
MALTWDDSGCEIMLEAPGFVEGAVAKMTGIVSIKGIKRFQPVRAFRRFAPFAAGAG